MAKHKGVAFVGPLRAGKSTMARYFRAYDQWSSLLSFAGALKEEVAEAVATNPSDRRRILGEMADPNEKHKWRKLLQLWGTEIRRDMYGENYWVDKVEEQLIDNPHLYFWSDDCRFPNEYEMLKKYNFAFVRCWPNPKDELLAVHETNHASEEAWSQFAVDVELPWLTVSERVDLVRIGLPDDILHVGLRVRDAST